MNRGTLNPQVRAAIADKLAEKGIELYELEYRREQNGQILRIYIDTPTGVDTDICALATRAIKEFIDTLENLDYDYLEVSSLGLDRVLKRDEELLRFRGSRVEIKTSQAVDGRKKFVGKLAASDPNNLSIEIEGHLVQLDRGLVTMVRLHPEI
ncbi:MAG: ribosome maturation factor RimP [candidate division Zixibacteria bacterium]|nr:ribosome maturation factor RimP [candidate division Zixibacteria bacterium]